MKIFVKAKPKSKIEKVEKMNDTDYSVSVKEPATENKANFAIIEALANHFNIPLSRVKLISGKSSKQKVFEIS